MPKQIKPKVTFYIDKNNRSKTGKAPIKANITINYKNKSKIIDHVFPSDWNPKQQRVRPPRQGSKDNNHIKINQKLDTLQKDFELFADNCLLNRIEITPDVAKQFLEGKRTATEKTFWPAYQEYLDTLRVEKKTKQNYELYYTKLGEFEKETGYYIDYHTIDTAFFERYQYYILETKELSWNTFATAIKKLKFFMNWSLKMKYHKEKEYKDLSAPEREGTVVFLTMDELKTLYHYDFGSKRLNQVRDKFCFGCFTSLAYSDLDSLSHEHINNGTLNKFRQKSKLLHSVELPKQAIEIIKRYKGSYKALPKISNDKFNKYIRECCEIAGIDTPTLHKSHPKGVETENIDPKYKLVGSHIARKTFITNFYHKTKDINLTKKAAAISQDKTLRRYMGTDKEMEKEAMKKTFGDI
ncbi:phage integrase SAM-like domain-containing protein [Draconibacterium sp.]|nr:phage integrase SAM-like domain-containing protein [Draconibacterium sp.]